MDFTIKQIQERLAAILEAEAQPEIQPERSSTKTAQQDDMLFNSFWQQYLDGEGLDAAAVPVQVKNDVKASFMQNVASGERTREKARQILSLTPDQAVEFARYTLGADLSGLQDTMSDEEAAMHAGVTAGEPKPTTPENLPKVISSDVANHTGVEVEWHMVKHLPGYMQNSIRALGRSLFSALTKTSLEKVQVIATFAGSGINTNQEVNAVATWLHKTGERLPQSTVTFSDIFPGYEADMAMYNNLGYTFLVVQDFAGHYIYSWPQSDSIGHERQKQVTGSRRRALPSASRG